MVFSVILILLVLVVAYFHYAQGLFTSAISIACALIAVFVAFGYYENLLNLIGQGKMADYSAGAMLMLLFGVTYLALRIIFDAAVHGNVTFQLYVERVGSAILGLVAGVLAVGTFAVAAQLMPFGPSIAMSARFPVADRSDRVVIPAAVFGANVRAKDSGVQNELVDNTLEPASAGGLLLPVDNIVLSLVGLASNGGFGGDQIFSQIHPDLPGEALAARLGADETTAHTLINTSKNNNADIADLFVTSPGVTGLDTEITDLRPDRKPITLSTKSADGALIVRVTFQDIAADKDGLVRVTPAAVRLVVDGVNYHPVGTMATADVIALNRLDDQIPIVMRGKTKAADFAFVLPKTVMTRLITGPKTKADAGFIELKLFGRIDLGGKLVKPYSGPSDIIEILRKPLSPVGPIANPPAKPAA